MPWAVVAALLAFAALLTLFLWPLRVRLQYEWSTESRPTIHISVRLLGWWTVPLPRGGPEGRFLSTPSGSAGLSDAPDRLAALAASLTYLRLIRSFEKLEWNTRVGTGCAASTALAVGALWIIKGSFLAWVRPRFGNGRLPRVEIAPTWDTTTLETRLDCIFRLRFGEIILARIGSKVNARRRGEKTVGIGKGTPD